MAAYPESEPTPTCMDTTDEIVDNEMVDVSTPASQMIEEPPFMCFTDANENVLCDFKQEHDENLDVMLDIVKTEFGSVFPFSNEVQRFLIDNLLFPVWKQLQQKFEICTKAWWDSQAMANAKFSITDSASKTVTEIISTLKLAKTSFKLKKLAKTLFSKTWQFINVIHIVHRMRCGECLNEGIIIGYFDTEDYVLIKGKHILLAYVATEILWSKVSCSRDFTQESKTICLHMMDTLISATVLNATAAPFTVFSSLSIKLTRNLLQNNTYIPTFWGQLEAVKYYTNHNIFGVAVRKPNDDKTVRDILVELFVVPPTTTVQSILLYKLANTNLSSAAQAKLRELEMKGLLYKIRFNFIRNTVFQHATDDLQVDALNAVVDSSKVWTTAYARCNQNWSLQKPMQKTLTSTTDDRFQQKECYELLVEYIRVATIDDLPRLVDLYNQAILRKKATADTVPFTVETRKPWFEQHKPDIYPIYVHCTSTGQEELLNGYLSISSYRGRPALARTAEISYYVDYSLHGKGIGSKLMEHAIMEAPKLNKKVFIAIVLEWNEVSVKLLQKFGFQRWGYLPDVAEVDGKTCGHLYLGRNV